MQDFTRYEYQACESYQNNTGAITWHWSNAPVEHLINCGWALSSTEIRKARLKFARSGKTIQEYGLDGIAYHESTNTYTGIQAKMRMRLAASDLGTYFATIRRMRFKNLENTGILYHANSKLEKRIQVDEEAGINAANGLIYINEPFIKEYNKEEIPVSNIVLYPHQEDALNSLSNEWNGPGILHMPCGTGKTITFLTHAERAAYKYTVILSPLRVHAKQTLNVAKKYISTSNYLLVDSDGTRNIDTINELLTKDRSYISATYRSADVLLKCFQDAPENALLIVDEAHKLYLDENAMSLVERFKKVLLVSATPPVAIDGYEDIQVLYSMSMRNAIQLGYITDYQVLLPTIESKDTNELIKLKGLDEYYRPRVQFLMACVMRNGLRRCIVYLPTVEACERFLNTCEQVATEYHGMPFWGDSITNETSERMRTKLLNKFQEGNDSVLHILTSVRILDEGVDIIRCDSVFFTEVPKTKCSDNGLRCAVQRLCRANRKDLANINKIAYGIVWAEEDTEIPNFLGLLKEEDPEFSKRIRRVGGSYECFEKKSAREIEEKETENTTKYVISVKEWNAVKRIEMKVQIFAEKYRDNPPKRIDKIKYKLSNGNEFEFRSGQFWNGIQNNWTNKLPNTKLSDTQKKLLEDSLLWLPEHIKKIKEIQEKKAAVYQPTIDDKIQVFIDKYSNKSPKYKDKIEYKLSNGNEFEFRSGQFWNDIQNNWTDKKPNIKLSDIQKKLFEDSLIWLPERIKKLKRIQENKASVYQPTIDNKIQVLIEKYCENPPKKIDKIEYTLSDGNKFEFRSGQFWNDIQNNWTDKKPGIKLSDIQKKLLEDFLIWLPERIKKLKGIRENKASVYQPTIDNKIQALIDKYRNNPPKFIEKNKYKLSDGNEFEFRSGHFWDQIQNNWTDKKPSTKLSDIQKKLLEDALLWLPERIKKLKAKQNAKIII